MTPEARAEPPAPRAQVLRVSNVELFFELIFVFAITQLTGLLQDAQEALDFLRGLLVLILIWWMYAGYVWLTNVTGAGARMRFVLIAAMAGFLVMGSATPRVYGVDGLAFGLAYLFVIVLHLVAFRMQGGPRVSRAVLLLAPFNLTAAILVIAAGLIDAPWDWLLFVAAVSPFIAATLSRRERGFPMSPGHFVDRHAGVMIIALGESVTGIGSGAAARALDAPTVAATVLSLAFIAAIWWSYFRRDHEQAEQMLTAASSDDRARLAVRAYWYPFIAMLFGIVLVATGIQTVVAHTTDPVGRAAWLISAGLAVYLLGSALFRGLIGIRAVGGRAFGAGAMLAWAAVGSWLPGVVWLAVAVGLVMAMLVVESRLDRAKREAPA